MERALTSAVRHGLLVEAKPIAPWAGRPRRVFLCAPIREVIEAGRRNGSEKERQSWAKVEAAFSHFIEGGFVTEDLLKQLMPAKYECWEFRCRKPRPSIRVFGRFAMPDVFVATHHKLRADLGGLWSAAFEHEKLVCEEHWQRCGLGNAFTDAPHFRYEAYITENARRSRLI